MDVDLILHHLTKLFRTGRDAGKPHDHILVRDTFGQLHGPHDIKGRHGDLDHREIQLLLQQLGRPAAGHDGVIIVIKIPLGQLNALL